MVMKVSARMRKQAVKMKKSDLSGWKSVFSFTLMQNLKSKAAMMSLIVICILIIFIGPISSIFAASGVSESIKKLTECNIEHIYFVNETETDFEWQRFKKENNYLSKVNIISTDNPVDEVKKRLEENAENDLVIELSEKEGSYVFTVISSEKSAVSSTTLMSMESNMEDFFFDSRMKKLGLSEDDIKIINVDTSSSVIDSEKITEDEDDDSFNPAVMTIVVIYAMIVMMLVLISSQSIATSIVIEKSSKVMETLLVSVKPLALIVGKIFGTIVYLAIRFLCIIVSVGLSIVISSVTAGRKMMETMDSMTDTFSNISSMSSDPQEIVSNVSSNAADINIGRILIGIGIIVVTILLGFLFYSVLAGINGASCSSIDDLQGASTFMSMSFVFSIYLVVFAIMTNNTVLLNFSYYFPLSGLYIVPVQFMFGKVGFLTVLIMQAELVILTVLLFRFAAKIYHTLIYHNGERIKLKHMIEISKTAKGK